MAIRFFNIKSGEVRVAEEEPQIAALWASSDHSPNVTQGQDFGWRLAPEVVIEMKRIKQDYTMLQQIAQRLNKQVDELGEPDILMYVSSKTDAEHAPVADQADYQDEYDDAVRRLGRAGVSEPEEPARGVDAISQSTDSAQTSNPTQPKKLPDATKKPTADKE